MKTKKILILLIGFAAYESSKKSVLILPKVILLLIISFSIKGHTAENPCHVEFARFCPNPDTSIDKFKCLLNHEKDLSVNCKQELQRATKVANDIGTRGGGGLSSFGGVMGGLGLLPPNKTLVSLSGSTTLEANPSTIREGKISMATPIWSSHGNAITFFLSGGTIDLSEQRNFDTGLKTPRQLNRIDFGGQYSKVLENKRMVGAKVTAGSASDKAFHSQEEMTFSMNSFYTYPGSKDTQWIWTVFLSNNNPIANYVPIPGFIYLYKNQGFTGMFGLPFFSMQWTPAEPWVFSLSYFITNLKMIASYGFRDNVQVFGGFSINQQSFLRKDREDEQDRLFFNDKRLFTGFKSPMTKDISGEIQGGLSFDRSLQEGKRFNDVESEADFGKSFYLSVGLTFLI